MQDNPLWSEIYVANPDGTGVRLSTAPSPTEMPRHLLAEFHRATFITVAGAAHPAIGWRQDCVPQIAAHFFATLQPGNTSCARRPA